MSRVFKKWLFVLLALSMFLLTLYGALAVSVDELNAKLSDPAFSHLPEDSAFAIRVYREHWGDHISDFSVNVHVVSSSDLHRFINGGHYRGTDLDYEEYDFVVGVKEEFLVTVLQVQDLCGFARGLPRNPDQYRILAYDWWGFVWKYRCFSGSGCFEKYCGGSV